MEDSLNNITEEEIKKQGENKGNICCDECGYETGFINIKDAVFKVNMQGGYFMYDGEGGATSKCPVCGLDGLNVRD